MYFNYGENPQIMCTPLQICQWINDAFPCVLFVKDISITFFEADGSKTPATLDQVEERNVPIKVSSQCRSSSTTQLFITHPRATAKTRCLARKSTR